MTITQSGASKTGYITINNEPAATNAAVAAAVSGCIQDGVYSYRYDRNPVLTGTSSFTAQQENITITLDTTGYGQPIAGGYLWDLGPNTSLSWVDCSIIFDFDQDTGSFHPAFTATDNSCGDVTIIGCILSGGSNAADKQGCIIRPWDTTKSFTLQDNTFINFYRTRGWGLVFGDGTSVVSGNKAFGCGTANVPAGVNSGNYAKDGDLFTQFNTFQTLNTQVVIDPDGENFANGTIQVLLRQNGTARMTVLDETTGRTWENFNPGTTGIRAANLDWLYRHGITVLDADDGLPEQGVGITIIPTTVSGPSAVISDSTDANGEADNEIIHSRDYFLDTSTPTETNTQYGPFEIIYDKWGFVTQRRTDNYDSKRVRENPRLQRNTTLTLPVGSPPSTTRTLTDLDELRDNWFQQTIDDKTFNDLAAGGGVLDIDTYAIAGNPGQTNSIDPSGTDVTIKAGPLAGATKYNKILIRNSITFTATFYYTSSMSLELASGAVATADTTERCGGALIVNTGAIAEFDDIGPTNLTGALDGRVRLTGATASNILDLRDMDVGAGAEVQVTGGASLTVYVSQNQNIPTKIETNGTITVVQIGTEVDITLNPGTSAVLVLNNLGAVVQYTNNETGTFNYDIAPGSTGTWTFLVKTKGYSQTTITKVADGVAGSFSAVSIQDQNPDGSAMYAGSTTAVLTVEAINDGSRLNQDVGEGSVNNSQMYDMTQDELFTQDGMLYTYNGGGACTKLSLATGNYLFNETAVRIRRRSPGDANATVNAIVESADGVVVDDVNGDVRFISTTDEQKITAHQGGVWIDTTSPYSGSAFPNGTSLQPVNNLPDAITIANGLGLKTFFVDGSLTINSTFEEYILQPSTGFATITLDAGASVEGSRFEGCIITGVQNGAARFTTCYLIALSGADGSYVECSLASGIVMSSTATSVIFSCCGSRVPETPVDVDLNGATTLELNVRHFSGLMRIVGSTSAGNSIGFDSPAGGISFSATNTDGSATVCGTGQPITDDSGAGFTLDDTGWNPGGSGGLTAQETRDAMLLTPTGAGSANSVDAKLDDIKGKTDLIPADPATETTVNTRASQASVSAIPTNPLLTNDARLNNLDATISSRATQTSVDAIPDNPLKDDDPRLDNLDATVSSRSTFNAGTDDVNTNTASREGSKAEVSNLDVPVSTRLASASYTAPDNTGIANAEAASVAVNGRLPATPADETTVADTNTKVSNMPQLDETLYNKNETTGEQIQTTVGRNPIP